MPDKITFSVVRGPLPGKVWMFEERDSCLIGRHPECAIQLPDDAAHKTISRHHALLDIAPPQVRIRDFGSLNGTFVNGEKIGARRKEQSIEEGKQGTYPERDLFDGDEVRVGDLVFQVAIEKAKLSRQDAAPQDNVSDIVAQLLIAAESRHSTPSSQLEADVSKIQGYKIIEELGRGGMGAVYLAQHKKSGQTVALKVMLPKVAVDERARAIFMREVELARALKHPNVVGMHDAGYDNGTFFFTLEYCELGSVDDYFRDVRGELPSLGEAFSIILQVLDGLDYLSQVQLNVPLADGSTATANGMVHRDLSPQNILLVEKNGKLHAKISDVGLGKAFDTAGLSGMTLTGDAAGKPIFMPRQQVVNFKFARPEVDIWAAAATLYYLLTGDLPRDFPDDADPWKIVLSTDPIPIRKRVPKCPAPLAEVIDRALRDKPALHYQKASDFQRDLLGALKASGIL